MRISRLRRLIHLAPGTLTLALALAPAPVHGDTGATLAALSLSAAAPTPAAPPPAPPKAPPPPPPAAPPPPPPPAPPPPPPAAPGTTAAPAPTPPAAGPALATLQAYLFHTGGGVGRDDIAIEPQARHIPQAALDAPTLSGPAGPSHATIVVVGVEGLAPGRPLSVSLTATSKKDGRVLLQKSVRLPKPGPSTPASFKVPFLLYDTGCETLRLVATLSPAAKGGVARLERLVPFHCGP